MSISVRAKRPRAQKEEKKHINASNDIAPGVGGSRGLELVEEKKVAPDVVFDGDFGRGEALEEGLVLVAELGVGVDCVGFVFVCSVMGGFCFRGCKVEGYKRGLYICTHNHTYIHIRVRAHLRDPRSIQITYHNM